VGRRGVRRLARVLVLLPLTAALSGCFASPPQIIALDPNRGSVGVPGDAPIVVQFDRPVVRSSVVGRFGVSPPISGCDLTAAFSAKPGAPCRVVWQSGDTGFTLLHPGAELASSTPYSFLLQGGFSDPEGAVNSVDHRWDITTASPPQVVAMTPPQGSTGVPLDLPLVVAFTSAMAPAATRSAITISPAIPGTRVVPNPRDHGRFVVLPGRPLQPGVAYRLTVGTAATDEHGQALAAPVSSSFTAGTMSPVPHAVVLAGGTGPASEVDLAALTTAAQGDPVADETELTAPLCPDASGCGAVPHGAPVYGYLSATLSPNAAWLAAVEVDRTNAAGGTAIAVINAATRAVVHVFPDASMPSWSPDSTTLAFASGAATMLYQVPTATLTQLPPGNPLLAPPVWEPRGELIVLASGSPAGVQTVELADALVSARYPVPGLTGASSDPAVSPDGTQLAVLRQGALGSGAWLMGIAGNGSAQPRLLAAAATPLGWTDPGTLLAVSGAGSEAPALVQVSVSGGAEQRVSPAPAAGAISSVSLSSSGRQFGFIAVDGAGVPQALVESVQGGSPVAVTSFPPGGLSAMAVSLS